MGLFSSNLSVIAGLFMGFVCLRFLLDLQVIYLLKEVKHEGRHGLQHLHTNENMNSAATSSPVRVLCWIMTGPNNLESRTKHIKETWAKRCNKVLYMSSVKTSFPTVGLNVSEGRENLYWKTIRAWQYIHKHHLDEADWFLKADDDTFVVVENLHYTLSKYDTEKPLYLGRRFAPFVRQGYMSGGAGYVLSKEALRRFIKGFSSGKCTHFSPIEDMALGKCMETMKVKPADTRDVKGRQTFHAYPPDHYLIKELKKDTPWHMIYDHYPPNRGPGCCSDFSVSFHYIYPVQQYVLEYLTYHLRPYGYKYRFYPDEHSDLNITTTST